MELQGPEADTTDDDMKAKCALVKILRNHFTDDDRMVDRKMTEVKKNQAAKIDVLEGSVRKNKTGT